MATAQESTAQPQEIAGPVDKVAAWIEPPPLRYEIILTDTQLLSLDADWMVLADQKNLIPLENALLQAGQTVTIENSPLAAPAGVESVAPEVEKKPE